MAIRVVTFQAVIETSDSNMEPSVNFVAQKILATFPHGLRNARFGMAMFDHNDNLKWTHVFRDGSDELRAAMDVEFGSESPSVVASA